MNCSRCIESMICDSMVKWKDIAFVICVWYRLRQDSTRVCLSSIDRHDDVLDLFV